MAVQSVSYLIVLQLIPYSRVQSQNNYSAVVKSWEPCAMTDNCISKSFPDWRVVFCYLLRGKT